MSYVAWACKAREKGESPVSQCSCCFPVALPPILSSPSVAGDTDCVVKLCR